jgi:hypothetical protein
VLAADDEELQMLKSCCVCDGMWKAGVPGEQVQDRLYRENTGAERDSESYR